MKRIVAVIVVIGVIAGLGVGLFFLGDSGGPAAATVGGRRISQQSVDEELRALVDSDELRQAIEAQAQQSGQQSGQQAALLSNVPGTITATNSSGWLSLIVAQTAAAEVVERRGLETTAADIQRGRALADQSLGGEQLFSTMPKWFQDRVAKRWTAVAVLEREAAADPSDAVLEQINAQCPSGRYVSHILVDTEAEALALKQELENGADFAELAMQSSKDTGTAQVGGDLGCADGQSFVEPFATTAATQPIGVVSDPVTTEFGSHLILVTDEIPEANLEQALLTEVLDHSRGTFVEVDPRYGTWDRRNGQVLPPPVPTTQPASAAAPTG
ncbi:MAG: peptidylprolyl isomerase [Acidimicrobiia bacterium]